MANNLLSLLCAKMYICTGTIGGIINGVPCNSNTWQRVQPEALESHVKLYQN